MGEGISIVRRDIHDIAESSGDIVEDCGGHGILHGTTSRHHDNQLWKSALRCLFSSPSRLCYLFAMSSGGRNDIQKALLVIQRMLLGLFTKVKSQKAQGQPLCSSKRFSLSLYHLPHLTIEKSNEIV